MKDYPKEKTMKKLLSFLLSLALALPLAALPSSALELEEAKEIGRAHV